MGKASKSRRILGLTESERGVERAIEAEVEFHLESRVESLVAQGMDRAEAMSRARTEFGDVSAARSELSAIDRRRLRRTYRRDLWDEIGQDMRQAVRSLARRPAYTAVAVLTLALGLGAASSIFAVVDASLLRALPFPEAGRLGVVWGVAGPERFIRGASPPEISDWRARTRSFEAMSLYDETTLNLSGLGAAEQLEAETVSPGFLGMLGATAVEGRLFLPEDDVPGITPPVIISYALWQRRFGGSADIVGKTLTLNGRSAVVVGVTGPGFRGLSFDTEIWSTLAPFSPDLVDSRSMRWLAAVVRLSPGVTLEQAQMDLESATVALEAENPAVNSGRRADVFTLHQYFLQSSRTLMLALLGSVGLLLLIACVNVLSLQLVRGLARGPEVAVRYSLGARRGRVVRQLITESLVLAGLAGAVALAVAWLATRLVTLLAPPGVIPPYADIGLDGRVLGVTAMLVVLAGVLSGLVPALRSSIHGLSGALRFAGRGGRESMTRRGSGVQRALVAVEVALAVALMLGATLMTRSLRAQLRVDPGFIADNVAAARVFLPPEAYRTAAQRVLFVDAVLATLRARPEIAAVAVGSDAPLRGNNSASILRVPDARGDEGIRYWRHRVSPDYFDALGIDVTSGRTFDATDVAGAPMVAVVSQSFAQKVWPGQDALGRSFEMGDGLVRIIGLTGDARYRDLTTSLMDPSEDPDVWLPFEQFPAATFDIIVKHTAGAQPPVEAIRSAVAAADPTIPIYAVARLPDVLARQTAGDRFGSALLALFGFAALTLAAIGLFGVMSFVVSTHRREIAIRIALGSSPRAVLGQFLRQGLGLVGVGTAAGLGAALLASQAISGILFGVTPLDPPSIALVVSALCAAAVLANAIPALRAARTDPQNILRGD